MQTITETAASSGSSIAAVVRLCKRIRIKGFRELKIRITWDVSRGVEPSIFRHIKPGSSVADVARSIIHNNRGVLDDFMQLLDAGAINAAAERIIRSRRIDIYGVGASGIVALDLQYKLLRLGLNCCYNASSEIQLTSACGLNSDDTAIAISYSGNTESVVRAARTARKFKAFTISLTGFGQNKLAEKSDLNLFVPSSEPLFRESAMVSRIAQLVMVDILFSSIASRRYERSREHITRVLKALRAS